MEMGARTIRSAGRTSGSIEITLPTDLQVLTGTRCRLLVREGACPEIAILPDLSEARRLLESLYACVRLGMAEEMDPGAFSAGDFALRLFAPRHWQETPVLAYADALTMLEANETPPCRLPSSAAGEAGARLLAVMALVSSPRLGLTAPFAAGYGEAFGFLATGISPGYGYDFERSMVMQSFADVAPLALTVPELLDERTWLSAQPAIARLSECFAAWQADPPAYEASRKRWHQALRVEMAVERGTPVDHFTATERLATRKNGT